MSSWYRDLQNKIDEAFEDSSNEVETNEMASDEFKIADNPKDWTNLGRSRGRQAPLVKQLNANNNIILNQDGSKVVLTVEEANNLAKWLIANAYGD